MKDVIDSNKIRNKSGELINPLGKQEISDKNYIIMKEARRVYKEYCETGVIPDIEDKEYNGVTITKKELLESILCLFKAKNRRVFNIEYCCDVTHIDHTEPVYDFTHEHENRLHTFVKAAIGTGVVSAAITIPLALASSKLNIPDSVLNVGVGTFAASWVSLIALPFYNNHYNNKRGRQVVGTLEKEFEEKYFNKERTIKLSI